MVSGATNAQKRVQARCSSPAIGCKRRAVALDCEMVGGGEDGSLDLCARVCIVDEHENILLNTFVKPELEVTNYRYLCLLKLAKALFVFCFIVAERHKVHFPHGALHSCKVGKPICIVDHKFNIQMCSVLLVTTGLSSQGFMLRI